MKCYANSKKSEFDRGFKKGVIFAVRMMSVVICYVLADKYGFGHQKLKQIAASLNYTADSVVKGYISLEDLETVLKEEHDITIQSSEERKGKHNEN